MALRTVSLTSSLLIPLTFFFIIIMVWCSIWGVVYPSAGGEKDGAVSSTAGGGLVVGPVRGAKIVGRRKGESSSHNRSDHHACIH